MYKYSYELKPLHQKSFYGKATVMVYDDKMVLKSYDTLVCEYDGKFLKKLWNGYSATTQKHINAFIISACDALKKLSKKEWCDIPLNHETVI